MAKKRTRALNNKSRLLEAKELVAKASVGSEVHCPSCDTKFVKNAYNSTFCKTKGGTVCKDFFWNNVTPKKRNNTTRISPASARYMADKRSNYEYDYLDDYDPGDSEYWDNKDF